MRILIISSCTGSKKYSHKYQIIESDFKNKEILKSKEINLKEFSCPAIDMYKGRQHLFIVKGINSLRESTNDELDFYIVSAGYGLINEKQIIAPYNITFKGRKKSDINILSKNLNINNDLQKIINQYDLTLIFLGKDYLQALELEKLNIESKVIFFISNSTKNLIPNKDNLFIIESGEEQRKKYGCSHIELKGVIFNALSESMVKNNISFEQIYKNPMIINNIIGEK